MRSLNCDAIQQCDAAVGARRHAACTERKRLGEVAISKRRAERAQPLIADVRRLIVSTLSISTPSHFSGGCACGAVRYECSKAPIAMINCHCRDCQRASGSGHFPTVIAIRSEFRIISGEPKYHQVTAESGSLAQRAFCADCGSPLFASSASRPALIGIRVGSLDDPRWFRATMDLWTATSQPWDILNPDTAKLPKEPPIPT